MDVHVYVGLLLLLIVTAWLVISGTQLITDHPNPLPEGEGTEERHPCEGRGLEKRVGSLDSRLRGSGEKMNLHTYWG